MVLDIEAKKKHESTPGLYTTQVDEFHCLALPTKSHTFVLPASYVHIIRPQYF